MADYDGLTPGQVLADASVAEFISQLGLGIAAAQRALDDNSVHQIAEFIVPREGLGGRTLLDLGLAPSFYHYQHADLSCSLQLSLRVEKDFGVALNLSGSYQDSASSDGTSPKTRHAIVHIEAASTGSLSVAGQRFALVGEDWRTRIRGLQAELTGTANTGIDLALITVEDVPPLDIETTAESGVEITGNAVAFIAGGAARGLIRISDNETTTFTLSSDETNPTTATADQQADVGAFAARAAERIDDAGYRTRSHAADAPIESVHFATGASDLAEAALPEASLSASVGDALLVIARLLRERPELKVEIEGYADAQPFRGKKPHESADLNLMLGTARARQVHDRLFANGAPSGSVDVKTSGGATDALAAGGPADNEAFRRVEDSGSADPETLNRLRISHMENALQRCVTRGSASYESRMVFLASIVTGAPFLGLLGTVWGVMDAFGAVAIFICATGGTSTSCFISGRRGAGRAWPRCPR